MNFQELNVWKKEIEKDLEITDSNVSEKCLKAANLFQKWLSVYIRESQILKDLKMKLEKIEAEKFKFYKETYDRQLTKGDIEYYVSLEPEYQNKKREYLTQESVCQFFEQSVENIKRLSFHLNSYIQLRIFLGGAR